MDNVLLARIQFGFAAGFHFLFPPTTLGLSFIIVILETFYTKTKEQIYRKTSSFLVKILGLVFVLGTATGITLEFAFGTNWEEYSRMVGDIFGAPLAAEGIFAFFLESVFLGVLVFGRKKVSKKIYWWSSFFVFFGAHLSGLWIIIANSWMQTPAGYRIEQGRAVLNNFLEAALNHSSIIRFIHTIVASWITGSLFVAVISSWYLLKKRHIKLAKKMLRISLIIFIVASFLQFGTGHAHSVQVAKTQPEKMAAYEALWETTKQAPLAIIALPNSKTEKNDFYIGIPKLLSYLIYFDSNKEIKGLKEFPKDERPPIFLTFMSYHIMIGLASLFVLMSLIIILMFFRKKWYSSEWFLKSLIFSIPLPYIANEFGWIGAEVGRQPWAVYKILRTKNAVSTIVPASEIMLTLLGFIIVYSLIFVVFIKVLKKIIDKGPEHIKNGY